MSKRTLTAVIVLALLATGAIGGLIGYAWHAPGRGATWNNIRAWVTFTVLIIGGGAALYQLRLQRKQLASQQQQLADQQDVIKGEVERNKRRDKLLDGQLRELHQRDQLIARAQAEQIDLTWTYDDDGSFAQVINDSRRPLRDITCHVKPAADSKPTVPAQWAAEMMPHLIGNNAWMVQQDSKIDGNYLPVIRGGGRAGFKFDSTRPGQDGKQLIARFTDDVGLRWELDNHLHLEQITDRGNL